MSAPVTPSAGPTASGTLLQPLTPLTQPDPSRGELELEKLRLEAEKLRLEGEKLRLEAGEIGRPQWRRATVLIPAVVAVVSTATAWVQYSTSSWKAEKAAYELMVATAKKDSVERASKGYEKHIADLRSDSVRLSTNNTSLRHSVDVATAGERLALTQGNGALSTVPVGGDDPAVVPSADPAGGRQAAIAGLFAESPGERGRSYDILIRRYADAPALIPELIAYAEGRQADWKSRTGQNGLYNTLVVLSHLNRDRLVPNATAIRAFAAAVRPLGPKIADRVDVLLSRLPL